MLHNLSKKSPPYHVTQADIVTPFQRLEVQKITRQQRVRGRVEVIAVTYETQWTGVSRPSWERRMDLQLFRHELFRYWAGTPNQHHQTNRVYRRIRNGAAKRELSRRNGERYFSARVRLLLSRNDGIATSAPRGFQRSQNLVQRATTVCGGLGGQRYHD